MGTRCHGNHIVVVVVVTGVAVLVGGHDGCFGLAALSLACVCVSVFWRSLVNAGMVGIDSYYYYYYYVKIQTTATRRPTSIRAAACQQTTNNSIMIDAFVCFAAAPSIVGSTQTPHTSIARSGL